MFYSTVHGTVKHLKANHCPAAIICAFLHSLIHHLFIECHTVPSTMLGGDIKINKTHTHLPMYQLALAL